jgi:hypothetical protein
VRRTAARLAGVILLACAPPERTACDPTPEPDALGTICGFDHPEDLEVVAHAGVVLASGLRDGAGLWAISIDELDGADPRPWRIWPGDSPEATPAAPIGAPDCSEPPDPARFHAHGLTARADPRSDRATLAVVSHGGREAVELFELRGEGRSLALAWRGCVPLPPGLMGNDVGIAPDGEIVVTNFVPLRQGLELRFVLAKAAFGFETGELLTWRRDRGWRSLPGTRGAGPNGMLLSPDGRFVYYAENGRDRIVRVPREGASPERPPTYAEVGGNPDNVSWTDDGRILAVVHTGGIEAAFEPCLMKWALWEIDPATLAARERLRHDGAALCGATSAAFVGDRYLIGSMSETRVGTWWPAALPGRQSIQ